MHQGGRIIAAVLVTLATVFSVRAEENRAPIIKHDPVKVAVRGQPITVLANVTDDSGIVKSVTLFYSLSRGAAPFRTVMQSSGAGVYFGSIPLSLVSAADSVSYYIEALDQLDAARETPWNTILIKDEAAPEKASSGKTTAAPAGAGAAAPSGEKANLLGIGVIAGGAAAVLGGALLVANQGDGDSDSSSGGDSGAVAGSYAGSVTECFTPEVGTPECDTHSISIAIDSAGVVYSTSLREGEDLQGNLAGNDFTLVASVDSGTNGTGEVVYSGTVIENNRIAGTIAGSIDSGSEEGSFSGSFSAVRQ